MIGCQLVHMAVCASKGSFDHSGRGDQSPSTIAILAPVILVMIVVLACQDSSDDDDDSPRRVPPPPPSAVCL